jgi:hypothetical protein
MGEVIKASEAGIWVEEGSGEMFPSLKWKWSVDRSLVIDKVTGQPVNREFGARIMDDVSRRTIICARHRKATRRKDHKSMGDAQAQVYAWLDRNFKIVEGA